MKRYMHNNEGVSVKRNILILLAALDVVAIFAATGLLIFYYGLSFPVVSVFMLMIMIISLPFCLVFWFIGKKVSVFSDMIRRGFMVGAFLAPLLFIWAGIEAIVTLVFG